MWSVLSRFSDPSTATRMLAGLLSRIPGPQPECETMPNFVASYNLGASALDGPADQLLVVEGP
jgi:hypothetical protein